MALEIERKFLVQDAGYRAGVRGTFYRQGYLSRDPDRTVRVRLAGERGCLTVKARAAGIARHEFEYEIPPADALALLDQLCLRPQIEKTRYAVRVDGHLWEVDEFHGDNAGLVVAEIELTAADQPFTRPAWLGREVTDDPRYTNAALSERPFTTW